MEWFGLKEKEEETNSDGLRPENGTSLQDLDDLLWLMKISETELTKLYGSRTMTDAELAELQIWDDVGNAFKDVGEKIINTG